MTQPNAPKPHWIDSGSGPGYEVPPPYVPGSGQPVPWGLPHSYQGQWALNEAAANWMVAGWRIESQTPRTITMVAGQAVNHVLHLILTLVTCGFWGLVWLLLAASTGVRRQMLQLGPDGKVTVGKIEKSGTQSTASMLIWIVLGLVAVVLVIGIIGSATN